MLGRQIALAVILAALVFFGAYAIASAGGSEETKTATVPPAPSLTADQSAPELATLGKARSLPALRRQRQAGGGGNDGGGNGPVATPTPGPPGPTPTAGPPGPTPTPRPHPPTPTPTPVG